MCSRSRAPWKACSPRVAEPGLDARQARRRFERASASYARASRLEAEVGNRMLERLDYVKLAPRRVLDAGSGPPQRALARRYPGAEVVALDFAPAMLRAGKRQLFERNHPKALCGDFLRLPIAAGALELVWSNMALHWAADVAGALREFHRVLAVDGLLMFSTLGPDTLRELRAAAGEARVHGFADMHDLGDMLVAAGFAEPVMDMERLTMIFADGAALLADLRASGQTSARADRARGLAGRGFLATLRRGLAAQMREGRLPVSFEVVYGHAWKAPPRRAADGRSIVRFERRR
ncbi:MAG: methyltransferase domain-containing protein [Burkholderiales bacterium]|nr:methyltransferase domain-containing protein [Burkholderiales bacterium]